MSTLTTRKIADASQQLKDRYLQIRSFSEVLITHLSAEDCGLQAMVDTSPPKWHLAHTTWFYETFILKNNVAHYTPFHPQYEYLFNSYYNQVGQQYQRPQRHLLSRPNLDEILDYRAYVNDAMGQWILNGIDEEQIGLLELGLNHEQQHQELLLMDIKYSFYQNPLKPVVQPDQSWKAAPDPQILAFTQFQGGLYEVGASSNEFCYDNESPVHNVYLKPFELANRLVTNQEYLAFIEQGGYEQPEHWLSDAWSWLQQYQNIRQPLYWFKEDGEWFEFTLQGPKPLDLNRPVCHISFYEADAYARWLGLRLASEQEWEVAASMQSTNQGHYSQLQQWHPRGIDLQFPIRQLYGELWEWTASPYSAYPGFTPPDGAVGEYNGKFMCNQMVLRGGACVTPDGHIRSSYRNFFYPKDRWPFSGIRLARDSSFTQTHTKGSH